MTVVLRKPLFEKRDLDRPGITHLVTPPHPGLVRRPHIDVLLTDAFSIVYQGLQDYRRRMEEKPEEMTLNDWKSFEIMSRQMVSLAGEERAQTSSDALDKLTDEELLQLSKDAEARLTSG